MLIFLVVYLWWNSWIVLFFVGYTFFGVIRCVVGFDWCSIWVYISFEIACLLLVDVICRYGFC